MNLILKQEDAAVNVLETLLNSQNCQEQKDWALILLTHGCSSTAALRFPDYTFLLTGCTCNYTSAFGLLG